jgi:uncharacterized membrane protein
MTTFKSKCLIKFLFFSVIMYIAIMPMMSVDAADKDKNVAQGSESGPSESSHHSTNEKKADGSNNSGDSTKSQKKKGKRLTPRRTTRAERVAARFAEFDRIAEQELGKGKSSSSGN